MKQAETLPFKTLLIWCSTNQAKTERALWPSGQHRPLGRWRPWRPCWRWKGWSDLQVYPCRSVQESQGWWQVRELKFTGITQGLNLPIVSL